MSNIDVVARLQLHAEQFSSEAGARFAEMKSRAASAAEQVRVSFLSSFGEVQKLAKQALSVPLTVGGKLDLSSEIAQLRDAAVASDSRAVALRELAIAQIAVASSGRGNAEALRLEADASAVASLAAERDAEATRERIAALEAVQAELGRSTVATTTYTRAMEAAAEQQRAMWREQATAARQEVEASRFQSGFAAIDTGRLSGKDARASAAVFEEEARSVADVERRVTSLKSAMDPLYAAQVRFNAEIADARSLVTAGALSLDDYCQKLRLERGLLEQTSLAQQRGGISAGQQRAAMQQLGFQLNDVATGFAAGVSPMVIFAQQGGQVTQALGMMSNRAGGVLGFLGGPWGAVLTAATLVAVPLVAKIFESANALDKGVKKLREHASEEEVSRQANALWESSVDGMIAKTRSLTDELERQLKTQQQLDRERLARAQSDVSGLYRGPADKAGDGGLNVTYRQRSQAEADRAAARANIPGDSTGYWARQAADADSRVKAANTRIAVLTQSIIEAQAAVRSAGIPILERQVASSLDESKAATDRYTEALGRLREARTKGRISPQEFAEQERHNQLVRDAAITAAQAARSANDNLRDPDTLTSATVAKMLRGALPGVQITATTNGKHVAGSDHYKDDAVDFVPAGGMKSLTKDDIRAVFAERGIPIRHNAAGVEQLFGPGDAGHSDHFHVAWEKGKQALDNYADAQKRSTAAAHDQAAAEKELFAWAHKNADELLAGVDIDAKRHETQRAATNFRTLFGDDDPFGDAVSAGHDQLKAAHDAADDLARHREQVEEQTTRYLASLYGDLFNGQTRNIVDNLRSLGADALGDLLSKQTLALVQHLPKSLTGLFDKQTVGQGAGYGQVGGSVFSTITGGRSDPLASSIGGVLGDVAGKALGKVAAKEIGGALGKTLGGAAGPIGAILGGVLGDVVGNLFHKVEKSSAGVGLTAGGSLGAIGATGSSAQLTSAASGLAGSVGKGLQQIADALGAQITGSTDVQIGTYKGQIRVNDHGGAIGGVKGSGAITYDTEEAAVRAAIADALSDGVLSGISDAALRILRSGQDIDKALGKALMIESIPKDLKAMLDPVGAALDALDTKWKATVAALEEGGATAEQLADAEKLYKLQLDQTKASTVSASQALKDFLTGLKVGAASPYSLRDQEATARAALDPYLTSINAGQSVDQSKYQEAARGFLDIERQLYGSTQAYFDSMDLIQDATNKAISAIDNAVPITAPVESPFVKATADAAAKTADNVNTGNEIAAQNSELLARIADSLASIAANEVSSSDFIGALRGFAVAA